MLTRGGCDVHRPPHQILGLWGDEKVIRELEKMCQDCNFNKSKALELIAKTDVNDKPKETISIESIEVTVLE